MPQVQRLLVGKGEKGGQPVVTDVAITKPEVSDKTAALIDVGQTTTLNTIALERYAAAMETANQLANQQHQLELMRQLPVLDTNEDGVVSLEELQSAIEKSPLFRQYLAAQLDPQAALIAVMKVQEQVFGKKHPLLKRYEALQDTGEDSQGKTEPETSGVGVRTRIRYFFSRLAESLIDD